MQLHVIETIDMINMIEMKKTSPRKRASCVGGVVLER